MGINFNLPQAETRELADWSTRELLTEQKHLERAVERDPCQYNVAALNAVLRHLVHRGAA